ncbi:MAG: protein translocase subunit SecD [Anaerolineae bacterium]|nr:protein translocase subunit SecD [Anaerolineae bacterium]
MNRNIGLLILIIVLALVAIYIDLPNSPGVHIALGPIKIDSDFDIRQGLDLQGGVQVLLLADLPADQEIEAGAMSQVATIVENRVNALGLTEPVVQLQGSRRIIVELPGVEDPEAAVATIRETGLLEFVDAGYEFLPPETTVQTTYPRLWVDGATTYETTAAVPVTPTGALTPTVLTGTQKVYATVLAGQHLKTANAATNTTTGEIGIAFELTDEGAQYFKDFTTAHADNNVQPFYYLSIVLDKQVISSPHIVTPITEGSGEISGNFTLEEARNLALQLRYGALPIPLKVESYRAVGPTLGQESVQRSIRAGVIGLSIVLLFMLLYYRVPGFLADLALILYFLFNLALYKAIPVTLTLPAITGFILSTGMAVDANILVFERMKEELRAGRKLTPAIEAGFSRAWTSIRDSNISTLITCAILFYFGSTFGAGSVKGFAVTLALGVIINIFTAITVTRTFLRLVFGWLGGKLQANRFLMGS